MPERRRASGAEGPGGPMTGRTVLVTGGTSGIGRATAEALARMGAQVAITGRHRESAELAAREIRAASGPPVDVFVGDLSSQAEVRRLAGEVLASYERLDVLVNNVGGYWSTRRLTADGLEHTFALNHLAPFLLTSLLLERLRQSGGGRVVTVSSHAHAQGKIDFEDLQGERSWSGATAYSQSKLANLLFTYELARRVGTGSVTANAVHPGMVRTSFGAEDRSRAQRVFVPLLRPLLKPPRAGARSSVYVASSPSLEAVTGSYFVNGSRRSSSPDSHDRAVAHRLWQVSSDLVGLPTSAGASRRRNTT